MLTTKFSQDDLRLLESHSPDLFIQYGALRQRYGSAGVSHKRKLKPALESVESQICKLLSRVRHQQENSLVDKTLQTLSKAYERLNPSKLLHDAANWAVEREAEFWQSQYEQERQAHLQAREDLANAYPDLRQRLSDLEQENESLQNERDTALMQASEAKMEIAREKLRLRQETEEHRQKLQEEMQQSQNALIEAQKALQGLSADVDLLSLAVRYLLVCGLPVQGVVSLLWGMNQTQNRSKRYQDLKEFVTDQRDELSGDLRGYLRSSKGHQYIEKLPGVLG